MSNESNATPIKIDGKVNTPSVIIEELDEATQDFRVERQRFTLHKDARVMVERWVQTAKLDWEDAGESDEIVIWSRSSDIALSQAGSQLNVRVDNQDYLISPSTASQRLTLQVLKSDLPLGLAEGFNWPLRIDSGASSSKTLIQTEDEYLRIYGTPQFQFRILNQLALLDGHRELKALLDDSKNALAGRVVNVLIMEQSVKAGGVIGASVFPAPYARESEIALLYNPYDGVDSDTELFKLLYRIFDSIISPSVPA
ncbi:MULTISPECIES: hypothetical protein [Pseudomonas]|uniref:Uncharacterized protein n=1 Tax=Pseudomonas fluorescens TaxID=294 RepID=A0A5E6TFZ5_PSEFL|nr:MULTISPECIES: hypothetical protein [Pseudomonas]VVM91412.1 hypothetical protein PS652_02811 [Pseudomonas fluorescens]